MSSAVCAPILNPMLVCLLCGAVGAINVVCCL